MEAAVGLLLMFGVSHGVETYCDGRRDGAQCYGVLGGSVDIQLMDNTSEINRCQLSKNSLKILDVKNNKVLSNIMQNRSLFIPSNGTFRINKLNRTDSGNYSLQNFDSDGKSSSEWTLRLFIQAPVSSVLLNSECLSQGERRVSCSSEGGDSPQYSWTLDGRTLTDAELLSGNNKTNNIITLKQHVSGRLVCSVRNNASNVSKEEMISSCGFIFINCTSGNGTQISRWVYEANNTLCIKPTSVPKQTAMSKETAIVSNKNPTKIKPFNQTVSSDNPWYITYLPLIGGVLSALLILLVVGVAGVCEHIIKQKHKPTEQRAEEDDQEVTYADVIITKCQRKDAEQRAEAEVEYGQIKFSSNRR